MIGVGMWEREGESVSEIGGGEAKCAGSESRCGRTCECERSREERVSVKRRLIRSRWVDSCVVVPSSSKSKEQSTATMFA